MMTHGPELQDVLRCALFGFVATREWREHGDHLRRDGRKHARWLLLLPFVVMAVVSGIVMVMHPMAASALFELQQVAGAP